MDISVVICTRDRPRSLARVLESARGLAQPAGPAWELLVVDNGAGDETRAVVDRFAGELPIRSVREPEPGLSNARNRGVAAAKGRYLVWTDDDVSLDPGWLAAYARAFWRQPDAAVFGGKVTPVLEPPTPRWFAENLTLLAGLTAHRDLGEAPAPLAADPDRLPFGANYAIRAAEQRANLYAPDLGVGPGVRRVGEEVQVIRSILAAGGSGWWVPDAAVFHMIPPDRQSEAYVARYHRGLGETWAHLNETGRDVFVGQKVALGRRRIRGAPPWVWREALANLAGYALARPVAPSRVWLKRLTEYAYYRGALDYWAGEARG